MFSQYYWHSILTHRLQLKPEQSPSLQMHTEVKTQRYIYNEVDCTHHTHTYSLTQALHTYIDMGKRNTLYSTLLGAYLGQAYGEGGGMGGMGGLGGWYIMHAVIINFDLIIFLAKQASATKPAFLFAFKFCFCTTVYICL